MLIARRHNSYGTTLLHPDMGNELNGINKMAWGWFDPVTGQRNDCTSPINGTLPTDRPADVIFIISVKKLHDDCYIVWHDKTNDVVFLDIGGFEPQYILGVIMTSTNTMILKNAADIEKMKVRYAEDVQAWREQYSNWDIFTKVE